MFCDREKCLFILQYNLRKIASSHGRKDATYLGALDHTRTKCRTEGIDAALKHVTAEGQSIEFDALLLCDRKGPRQQLAAQAGDDSQLSFISMLPANDKYLGYPIICVPIGVDSAGLPFSLSIQHSAWREHALIKWASAIEDLVYSLDGWRVTPQYKEHLSKNIPIERISMDQNLTIYLYLCV